MAQRAEVLALDIEVESKRGVEGVKNVRAEVEKLARARGFEIRQARQRKAARETNEALAAQRRELAQLRRTQGVAASAAGRSSKQFGAAFGAIGRGAAAAGPAGVAIAGVGEGLRLAGAAAEVATDAIELQARALIKATEAALAFGSEITRVSALTGGGARDFEILEAAALKGGASTLFSAQQAAEGLRFLATAGLDAQKAAQALPGTLQLAAAGQISLAKAADISTNILTGYNLEVSELGRVNDVLVQTTTSTNTNVTELGNAFSYTAGLASATNQTIENTTAILGALANAGIKGSKSGRAVANSLQRIIKPTAEGAAVLAQYNITTTEADGTTRQLVDILADLERAGASSADILRLFGTVAGRSLVTLLEQGTGSVKDLARELRNAEGRAAEFEKQLQASAGARLQIFQSTLETTAITIGKQFNPAVAASADVLTAQLQAILADEEALEQFAIIANDAAIAAGRLAGVAADLAPPMIILSGVTLEAVKAIDALIDVAQLAASGLIVFVNPLLAVVNAGVQLNDLYSTLPSAVGDFGSSLDAAIVLSEKAGSSSERLAGGLDGVGRGYKATTLGADLYNAAVDKLNKALETNAERQERLAREAQNGQDILDGWARSLANAALETERLTGAQVSLFRLLDNVNRLSAQASVSSDGTDATLRNLALVQATSDVQRERIELQGRLNKLQREQQEFIDSNNGARSEEIDLQILLETERTEKRIASIRQRERDERRREREQAARARAQAAQDLADLANLAERAASANQSQLDELIDGFIDGFRQTDADAFNDLTDGLIAGFERADAAARTARDLQLERLKITQRQGVLADQLNIIELEAKNRIADLNDQLAQTGDRALTTAERQNVEEEKRLVILEREQRTRDAIAQKQERALARQVEFSRALGGAGQGLTGFGALAFSEAGDQRALDAQLATLAAQQERLAKARQTAAAGGADTRLLEAQEAALARRAEGLRTEFELERQNQQLLRERLGLYAEAANQAGELGAQIAILGDSNTSLTESYDAQAAAISATVGVASALAAAGIEGTKQQAVVQALFNGAASIATFAAYASSGFVAGNLLTASINHGLAAAKFGLVAGASGAVSTPRTGGGGRTQANPRPTSVDTGRINQRGRDSRASIGGGAVNVTYDLSRATFLESATATQRRLMRLQDRAGASTIQLGGVG